MKRLFGLLLVVLSCQAVSFTQTTVVDAGAAKIIQPAQSVLTGPQAAQATDSLQTATENSTGEMRQIRIPAGTPIEIEVAYTVNSIDLKPGELISFRVLIPIMIDGSAVIEEGALVTARVTEAKRGGHWGKGGRLAWSMLDVIAADNTRIPLAPETTSRGNKLWSLEPTTTKSENRSGQGSVKGTSHGGEVATKTIVAAALFPPFAPLALLHGFKRGENAVLPEGKRFVVVVRSDTNVINTWKK